MSFVTLRPWKPLDEAVLAEAAAVEAVTGKPVELVRPMDAARDARLLRACARLQYTVVYWSVCPWDWQARNVLQVQSRCVQIRAAHAGQGQGVGWQGRKGASDLVTRVLLTSSVFGSCMKQSIEASGHGRRYRNARWRKPAGATVATSSIPPIPPHAQSAHAARRQRHQYETTIPGDGGERLYRTWPYAGCDGVSFAWARCAHGSPVVYCPRHRSLHGAKVDEYDHKCDTSGRVSSTMTTEILPLAVLMVLLPMRIESLMSLTLKAIGLGAAGRFIVGVRPRSPGRFAARHHGLKDRTNHCIGPCTKACMGHPRWP